MNRLRDKYKRFIKKREHVNYEQRKEIYMKQIFIINEIIAKNID